MKSRNTLTMLLLLLALCGCRSYVPFTGEHYKEFKTCLSEFQFYNSEEIRIECSSEMEESLVDNNAPLIRKNRNIFIITIPRYTLGILDIKKDIQDDMLYVQFEPAGEGERVIPFIKIQKHQRPAQQGFGEIYQFSDPKLTYDGKSCNVIFRQKKIRVDEENTTVYVGEKDDKSDKHYVVKTLYPILSVSPTELDERTYKSHTIAPGVRVEK